MDLRITYPDYAQLIGDRRPQRHKPSSPIRTPRGIRGWLR
jgi:hypothetical protein